MVQRGPGENGYEVATVWSWKRRADNFSREVRGQLNYTGGGVSRR